MHNTHAHINTHTHKHTRIEWCKPHRARVRRPLSIQPRDARARLALYGGGENLTAPEISRAIAAAPSLERLDLRGSGRPDAPDARGSGATLVVAALAATARRLGGGGGSGGDSSAVPLAPLRELCLGWRREPRSYRDVRDCLAMQLHGGSLAPLLARRGGGGGAAVTTLARLHLGGCSRLRLSAVLPAAPPLPGDEPIGGAGGEAGGEPGGGAGGGAAGGGAGGALLPVLEVVDLNGCGRCDDDCVARLAFAAPALRELSVRGCDRVGDAAAAALAARCPRLERLNVSCSGVGVRGVRAIVRARGFGGGDSPRRGRAGGAAGGGGEPGTGLKTLDLCYARRLAEEGDRTTTAELVAMLLFGDDAPRASPPLPSSLEMLGVGGFAELTDAQLAALCTRHAVALRHVGIGGCRALSEGGAAAALCALPRLEVVVEMARHNIPGEGFHLSYDRSRSNHRARPRLKRLNAHKLPGVVTPPLLRRLAAACPNLRGLEISGCVPKPRARLSAAERAQVEARSAPTGRSWRLR